MAKEYEGLKIRLASASPKDRLAYTRGKTEFIARVTEKRGDAIAPVTGTVALAS